MIESLNATEWIDRSLSSIIELFLKLNHLTPVLLHRPIPGSGGGRRCRCGSQQQPHLRQPMGSGQCLFFLRDNHHNNRWVSTRTINKFWWSICDLNLSFFFNMLCLLLLWPRIVQVLETSPPKQKAGSCSAFSTRWWESRCLVSCSLESETTWVLDWGKL